MRKSNSQQPPIRQIIAERVSRRGFLLGSAIGIGAVASQGSVGLAVFLARPWPRTFPQALDLPN